MDANPATTTASQIEASPSYRSWLIVITVMLLSSLELFDSTVINVSLRHMMAALGADQNQITWIVTAYVTASAIMLPLTGFLANRLGQKNLLLTNTLGFMIASCLCGIATTLPEMIIFRILQGVFGSSLIALSQSILRQTFPQSQIGKAMAIWLLGLLVAPAFGPTIGAYITEYANWRWIFYINFPLCLIGFFLALTFIPRSPRKAHKIDGLGLALMVIGVASLQIFLDKGNENNWLESNALLILLLVSISALIGFLVSYFFSKNPLINLGLYKDRNFTLASVVVAGAIGALSGAITLEPMMLQTVFNYPPVAAGKVMGAMGLGTIIAALCGPSLMKHVNIKIVATLALILSAYSLFCLGTITLQTDMTTFLLYNFLLGFSIGSMMVPVNALSLMTIPLDQVPMAAGLYSYLRMMGNSIGVSLTSTLVTRAIQTHWHTLSQHLSPYSAPLHAWFSTQQLPFMSAQGIGALKMGLQQQAALLGFLDGFKILALVFLALIPLIFVFKKTAFGKSAASSESLRSIEHH